MRTYIWHCGRKESLLSGISIPRVNVTALYRGPSPVPSDADGTESETWTRGPSPDTKNMDGRPIGKPPVLRCDELIGEDYEQKRKGYLKCTSDGGVKTTEMLGISTEYGLLKYLWGLDRGEPAAIFRGQ